MSRNQAAKDFKALHVPSKPIIVPNVWDIASLNAVASLNTDSTDRPVKAVATSSWSVAGSLGIGDEDLTFEQNIAAVRTLGTASKAHGIHLTVDLGDGYGSRIEEAISAVIEAGAVGANIEDSIPSAGHAGSIQEAFYDQTEQVQRLKLALKAAREAEVPDFVLNARSDIFILAPHPTVTDEVRLEEAIRRGKAYLEAGATTVFFPSIAGDGLGESTVKALVGALDGRVTILPARSPTALSTKALAELGVARLQYGASFFIIARDAIKTAAARVLSGESIV